MVRGAIARLYDVDDDTVVFKKFNIKNKYDHATVTFRAKKGKLIDLQKLHESLWATRLSGGTRSGVICLELTTVGEVVQSGNEIILKVNGTDREFVLVGDVKAKPQDAKKSVLPALLKARESGKQQLSITGYVDGWVGRWPGVLSRSPVKRPRLMVTGFESIGDEAK